MTHYLYLSILALFLYNVGAACILQGSSSQPTDPCVTVDQITCDAFKGEYIEGEDCVTNDTSSTFECCTAIGSCLQVSNIDSVYAGVICYGYFGGVVRGGVGSCNVSTCALAINSCCKPDGACADNRDEADCLADGGKVNPLMCAAGYCRDQSKMGSCYTPKGCSIIHEDYCAVDNVTVHFKLGDECEQYTPNNASTTLGACCQFGLCSGKGEGACTTDGGIFYADKSCADSPCTPYGIDF